MRETQPVAATMFYNTGHRVQSGAFKTMRRGRINPSPFEPSISSPDGRVAVKQLRNSTATSISSGSSVQPDDSDHVTVLTEHVAQLVTDVLATLWADALLRAVYEFIDTYEAKHRSTFPWEIPRFRYVRTGLAVTNVPDSAMRPRDKAVYLVEELIDSEVEGEWRKYMNNNTARHRFIDMNNSDPQNFKRAEFLAFCQHFQYWHTSTQAFTADFQGGNTLLSDPQIITDPCLGRELFSKGNLANTHRNFKRDHVCNTFCKYFELPDCGEL
ncbi:uncharacterized protein B0H18DRAFT_974566 [Fomitopsis serialis]|uniref:uncharacterized protein n=1 Tax=Fomitopsis serialis TaxID=139415 RepID=UPI002007B75A|nr:uncharacterized protein B0H18DRAFT_1004096 [Neoantrodia serialis]XP_047899962.1 uncharacterized protein B0H18DRAFT_974566 [Neoantrodia serialis]KAH9927323.1 hypothetical protein B0H18DRAFT_1004096 [Neoantrodia serialis]KAH9936598.1 hypothetical protein B0H18DRAFT_974566 [Neoantrodia serialis]